MLALWRWCGPTVNRAMIVTASQMAVYDKSKSVILRESGLSDGLAVQTGASFFGRRARLTSNPIDLAKSRLMSMKPTQTPARCRTPARWTASRRP